MSLYSWTKTFGETRKVAETIEGWVKKFREDVIDSKLAEIEEECRNQAESECEGYTDPSEKSNCINAKVRECMEEKVRELMKILDGVRTALLFDNIFRVYDLSFTVTAGTGVGTEVMTIDVDEDYNCTYVYTLFGETHSYTFPPEGMEKRPANRCYAVIGFRRHHENGLELEYEISEDGKEIVIKVAKSPSEDTDVSMRVILLCGR